MKRKTFSIKAKLLGILIPVVIGIIAIIIFNIYQSTSGIIIRKSETLLETNTESVVNKVTAWMNETLTALNMEKDSIEFFSPDKADELEYIRHTANRYASFPAGIYLGLKDGSIIHASFVPDANYSFFEKDWYKNGIESEKFVFTPVYLDEDSQSYVVGASAMLLDQNGDVRGAAAADIYLDAISDIVADVQVEQTGAMYLVDTSTGIIIGHKDPAMVGTVLTDKPDSMYSCVNELITNKSFGLHSYAAPDGNDIYLQLTQVPGSEWVAIAYVPHGEIVSDLNTLIRKMVIISICGILILIVLMERFIHFVIKPVKKLNLVVNAMAEGDFTTDINVKTKDEIGVMADSVHRFILIMRDILKQISEVTSILNTQSLNSTKVATSLSQASDLQSDSMNDMNQTVEELTRSIMEVAESASTLSSLSSDTKEKGDTADEQMQTAVKASALGKDEMKHLLDSMNDISRKIDQLEKSSEKMGASIHQINSMVDFIRDIAEETNLLSLNASIEAARAGDTGRGFAIVANQIGKLALNSKNAVDDISNLTTQISALVSQTAQETKDSVATINEGSDTVARTESVFRSIYEAVNETDLAVRTMIEKVDEVTVIAASLAGITQEQSAASEEILASVETMQENAHEVSESSKTVADDADSLQLNASRLKEQLDLFKIE